MTDAEIIQKIESVGISAYRLRAALDSREDWGGMVHAFEFLTVLGIVADAMTKKGSE